MTGRSALLLAGNLVLRPPTAAHALDLAVVIDRSGSMYDKPRRIDAVLDGLLVLAACLRAGDCLSVTEFGSAGNDHTTVPFAPWSDAVKQRLVAGATAMLAKDLGGTQPLACLKQAFATLTARPPSSSPPPPPPRQSGVRSVLAGLVAKTTRRSTETAAVDARDRRAAVLFLGDGDLGGAEGVLSTAAATSAHAASGITTAVLAIGYGCNTGLLKSLAAAGGGPFEHALTGDDMLQTMAAMVNALRESPTQAAHVALDLAAGPGKEATPTALHVDAWLHRLAASNPTASAALPVVAVTPSVLRATSTVTIAAVAPTLPTAVRLSTTDAADGGGRTTTLVVPVLAPPAITPSAPGPLASGLAIDDAAICALAGSTLIATALASLDRLATTAEAETTRAALEGHLTALAVELGVACRLTAWIGVDAATHQPVPTATLSLERPRYLHGAFEVHGCRRPLTGRAQMRVCGGWHVAETRPRTDLGASRTCR